LFDCNKAVDGMRLILWGLFKKIVIADKCAEYVDLIFKNWGDYSGSTLLIGAILFAFQIYGDFSGYSDIAIGTSRLLGVDLMRNFAFPYFSRDIAEFWRRWHISLTSWFKDYVYIPLGGNRKGRFKTYRNMFLTLVISGLWHGTAWTFVIWGVVHAIGYSITRGLERTVFYKDKVPKIAKQLFVFIFVSFAWIFFRADTINDAWVILARIFSSGFENPYCPLLALVLIVAVWLYQFAYESRIRWILELRFVRIGIVLLLVFYLVVFAPTSDKAFIYLQF